MTCEDFQPTFALALGLGGSFDFVITGFDFAAVLIKGTVAGATILVSIISDDGTLFIVFNHVIGAGFPTSVFCFGGSGGSSPSDALTTPIGAVPFVPNRIRVTLSATVANTWTGIVMAGYNE